MCKDENAQREMCASCALEYACICLCISVFSKNAFFTAKNEKRKNLHLPQFFLAN